MNASANAPEARTASPGPLLRPALYLFGLCLYAWSICLMTRARAGVSPISSFPFAVTAITGLTFGTTQFCMNMTLLSFQIAMLRREFPKFQLLQILVTLVFSSMIDFFLPLTAPFDAEGCGLAVQAAVFLAAMCGMGLGLGAMSMCNFLLTPADSFTMVLSKKIGWDFGKTKLLSDTSFVTATSVLSLSAAGRIIGVQWGTVCAAFGVGMVVRSTVRAGGKILAALNAKK